MNNSSIEICFILWIIALGLCIGSFLNVVILRGLSGESIVLPPSKCTKCGNKLKWWMNIPLLSYIFLKGKCYYCKENISIQYPVVEFLTAIFFLLIFLKFGFTVQTVFYFIAFSILTVMSVCDIKESVIFDIHAYILTAAGLILNILTDGLNGFLFAISGAVLGFLIYEIIARTGILFAGMRAFGEGDSLIASGIGAYFGWKLMLISIALSVITMAIFTFPYFFLKSRKEGKKKTCFALILSLFLIISAFCISKTEIIKTFEVSLAFVIFMMILAFLCAKLILDDIKNNNNEKDENSFCMLPFGPAMAISFIIIMFYSNELTALVKSYFG